MFVEDCISLDVSQLVRKRTIGPNRMRQMTVMDGRRWLQLEFDIAATSGSLHVFEAGRFIQTVRLELRADRRGRRKWRFMEGPNFFQKLYLFGGRFASRQAHGLQYRSVAEAPLDRFHRERAEAKQRLDELEDDPDPDEDLLDQALDALVSQEEAHERLAQLFLLKASKPKQNRAERKRRFMAQVQRTSEKLTAQPREPGMSHGELETTVAHAIAASPANAGEFIGHFQSDKRLDVGDRAHLSLPALQHLGLMIQGELRVIAVGWPDKWLGRPGRLIDLVLDLRSPQQSCAVILIRDEDKIVRQLFWLATIRGDFGRPELRWLCPASRRFSKLLVFKRGRFAVPTMEG